MTLTLLELRRLATSPILWLGVALMTAGAMPDIFAFWPLVEGNDLIAHDTSMWLMALTALAGGWLGLRDRRTNTQSVVGATPADGRGVVVPARIAALVAAGFAAFALVFCASLLVTVLRGGHGTPDVRLYVDGALVVVLGSCVGYGLGYLTGSRTVCLFAGPALPALNQLLLSIAFEHPDTGPVVDWGWLLPSVFEPHRSVAYGFLPDIWTGHIVWLAALVMLVSGGTVLIAARRARAGRVLAMSMATLAMGTFLAAISGAWLMSQPHSVIVLAPNTVREIHSGNDYYQPALVRLAREVGPWPDDGGASACSTSSGFEVCVFPEFGHAFAGELAAEFANQARLLGDLDVFPTRARMVPNHWAVSGCTAEEALLFENRSSPLIQAFDNSLVQCTWRDTHGAEAARAAVVTWLFAAAHPDARDDLAEGRILFAGPGTTRVGLAMAGMSPEDVRAQLAPIWDELKRGTLPLTALPGFSR